MSRAVNECCFDRILAVIVILVIMPFLVFRSIVALYKLGSVFEKTQLVTSSGSVSILKFAGFMYGRNLGYLFNIVNGDVVFVGNGLLLDEAISKQRTIDYGDSVLGGEKCCLVNLQKLRERSGTQYENEVASSESILAKLGVLFRYLLIKLLVGKSSYQSPEQFSMLGVPIDNMVLDDAVSMIVNGLDANQKSRYAFVNADCLNISVKNIPYRETLSRMTAVFADGIGLQMGARILGVNLKGNVNGTDLLPRLCTRCLENDYSIYLLGGKPGVSEDAAKELRKCFPNLRIVGTQHGYFGSQELPDIIRSINESKADILLVGLGAPIQEGFIENNFNNFSSLVQIGVGGLFDFHTSRISRAPRWVQDIGMEWVWRLKQEPMRLWKRYLIGNPLFLYRIYRQSKDDSGVATYRRFMNPYRTGIQSNKRYIRQQNVWIIRHQLLKITKRFIDIVVASSALVFLSPLMLLVSIIIKIESRGPVLFQQNRIGRYGEPFNMLKFRSMRTDAERAQNVLLESNEVAGGVTFKMKIDPRVTRIGRTIRRYSIDELPQLINVLKGEMSLVGPRPPLPNEVDKYSGRDRRRLEVTPGITGLWQVSGRSDTTFEEQVELDIDYLESRGTLNDIIILLKTIPAVFSGRGAY